MKKTTLLSLVAAATIGLAGCAHTPPQHPMPADHHDSYQSGHSSKLGKLGRSHHKAKKSVDSSY